VVARAWKVDARVRAARVRLNAIAASTNGVNAAAGSRRVNHTQAQPDSPGLLRAPAALGITAPPHFRPTSPDL